MQGSYANDPYNLQRFVDAQNDTYESVRSELSDGRKHGHWMWFIFPQISGLGHSHMSKRYAISSVAEAKEYLNHPVLGTRLRECTKLVITLSGRSISDIFGAIDAMKFRSCMTLFAHAAPEAVFAEALRKYFGGELDAATLERLQ